MRVFVTGATGFVGSAVVQELIGAGHHVIGLVRSDAAAQSLAATGAEVLQGDLKDLDSLQRGAGAADAVIHTAFIHDFTNLKESCEVDERAIAALGAALAGSKRLLIVTSGTALVSPGRLVTEDLPVPAASILPRVSELAAQRVADLGVPVSILRLPPSVHGDGDHGFVPLLIGVARQKGAAAFIGDGLNRWAAVHRLDAARLYRLALEQGTGGARYHAIGDSGVPFRDIAAIIGRHLNVPVISQAPEAAAEHFGWFAHFAALDTPASSSLTQQQLGWQPREAGLIADLDHPRYFGG